MPFTPDAPYPKTPGNPIMAKDWNDAIGEVQRLEIAKVNRLATDTIQGPLTITNALTLGSSLAVGTTASVGSALAVAGGATIGGALAVGTTQAAGNRLHVVDTASPAVARVQTTAANGSSRLELWSDPRGSGTEWRPGYIESFDTGSFTGGLRFFTNGTGQANRQGSVEALRVVNGLTGFGVTNPAFRVDALGPIRSRNNGGVASGLWLNQPSGDRAFVGMLSDNVVGLMGNAGGGWSLQMDVTNGNLGVRTAPTPTNALTVTGNSQLNGDVYNTGNTALGHSAPAYRLDILGRMRLREQAGSGSAGLWFYQAAPAADRAFIGMNGDNVLGLWGSGGANWGLQMDVTNGVVTCNRVHSSNVKTQALESAFTSTTSGAWSQIGNMSVTFFLPVTATCFVNLVLPGCALDGVSGNWGTGIRLVLDGVTVIASQVVYFNWTSGVFETRHLVMSTIRANIPAGTHTIAAQWYTQGGQFYCSNGGADRVLQIIELD